MSSAQTDTLRQLEEDLLKPEVRRSADQVGRLIADDFIEFGSSGAVYDKRQIIAALQNEASEPPTRITLTDFTVRSLAPDVALVTYRSTREGTSTSRLRSSIWKLFDGRWQMIFHQGTPSST